MQPQIVFFGSSPFSVIVLEKLLASNICHLVTIVTTPDKPAGRGMKLTPNPVKVWAEKNNIKVFTSPSFPLLNSGEGGSGRMGEVLGLVAAYGQILKQEILDKFNNQIYNIHPSLLPKYRGPSPLQQQILDGVVESGVTLIQLDAQMDHGPVVAQQKDIIHPNDTWKTLGNRLFARGAEMFITSPLRSEVVPQNHAEATFTKKLTRQDGFVPWEEFNPAALDRKMRAFQDWPGVWTVDPQGKRVKLVSLHPLLIQSDSQNPRPPSLPKTLQSTPKSP